MGNVENEDDQLTEGKTEKGMKGHSKNRANRNKSEKDRRDKLNDFINELATMVPECSSPTRKLDKATILQKTVDFMKVHNDLTVSITGKDSTSFLTSDELGQLMLEGCYAFLFAISLSGTFTFVSESVEDLLGYSKDELLEKNIYEYINPEDELVLTKQLRQGSKTGLARTCCSSSFFLRMKAKVGNTEKRNYETLRCIGRLTTVKKGAQQEIKSKETVTDCEVTSSNNSCFVVLAEAVTPNYHRNTTTWADDVLEFDSRQSLDGKFLYLDPRCIKITGYLPYEILGSVIYEHIHCDDLEGVTRSVESLIESGEGKTGNYRILTKGSQWIVIQTNSYISYNYWSSKPEFICSTHQLVRNAGNLSCHSIKEEGNCSLRVNQESSAVEIVPSPSWKAEPSSGSGSHESLSGRIEVTNERCPSPPSQTSHVQRAVSQDSSTQIFHPRIDPRNPVTRVTDSSDGISRLLQQNNPSIQNTTAFNSISQSPHKTPNNVVETPHPSSTVTAQSFPVCAVGASIITTISPGNLKNQYTSETVRNYIRPNITVEEKSPLSPGRAERFSTTATVKSPSHLPGNYQKSSLSFSTVSNGRSSQEIYEHLSHSPPITAERYPQSMIQNLSMTKGYPVPAKVSETFPQISHVTERPSIVQFPSVTRSSQSSVGKPTMELPEKQSKAGTGVGMPSSPLATHGRPPPLSVGILDRYHQSPLGVSEGPFHPPGMTGRYSMPQAGITEGFLCPPTRVVGGYSHVSSADPEDPCQSPNRMVENHPQSPIGRETPPQSAAGTVNRYAQLPASVAEKSCYPTAGEVERYSRSLVLVSEGSHQIPYGIGVNRYAPFPAVNAEGFPQSSNKYPSPPVRIPNQHQTLSPAGGILSETEKTFDSGVVNGRPQSLTGNGDESQLIRSPQLPSEFAKGSCPVAGINFLPSIQITEGSSCSTARMMPQTSFAPPETHRMKTEKRHLVPTSYICESDILKEVNADSPQNGRKLSSEQQLIESAFPTRESDNMLNLVKVRSPNQDSSSNVKPIVTTNSGTSGFVNAQKILQEQLVEKQNRLQSIIQKQKRQLTQIQEQISLNAQAQFSVLELEEPHASERLQHQAQILEMERKQHETRHKDLETLLELKMKSASRNINDKAANDIQPYQSTNSPFLHTEAPCTTRIRVERLNNSSPAGIVSGDYDSCEKPSTCDAEQTTQFVFRTSRRQQQPIFSFSSMTSPTGVSSTDVHHVPTTSTHTGFASQPATSSTDSLLETFVGSMSTQLSLEEFHPSSLTTAVTRTRTQSVNTSTISNSASSSEKSDYFSRFSSSELETFLSTSSVPSVTSLGSGESSSENTEKEEPTTSTFDSLSRQQKQLLEMQEEQRRQLLVKQQEQLLRIQRQQQQEMLLLQMQQSEQKREHHASVPLQTASSQTQNTEIGYVETGTLSGDAELPSTYELTDEDQCVVDMLLAEGSDLTVWSEGLF